MFVIALVAVGDQPILTPLAIGLGLVAMVYMGGHVSGAHYNPAVSIAILLRGKMDSKDLVPYVLAQIMGALCAFGLGFYLTGKSVAIAPGAGVDVMKAIIVEVVFTFMLALTVLNIATHKKTATNSSYGLAIGLVIVVAIIAGGGISGGAFNPAVAIGATTIDAMAHGGTWSNLWIYLVGPIAGGILAALIFKAQCPVEDRD